MSDDVTLEDLERVCLSCKVGFHNECALSYTMMLEPEDECCCKGMFSMELYEKLEAELAQMLEDADYDGSSAGKTRVKNPGDVKDWESTGRKRAAEIAPIFDDMVCEFAFLKHAGGGAVPIVGCNGSKIFAKPEDKSLRGDRHHGPDKNVLNNAPGTNLHRLCTSCHNRWHSLNDKFYALDPQTGKALRPKPDRQYLPDVPYWEHDAKTQSNDADYAVSEEWWEKPPARRPEYPFRPTTEPKFPVESESEDGSPNHPPE